MFSFLINLTGAWTKSHFHFAAHSCTFPSQAAQLAKSLLSRNVNETSHQPLWSWETRKVFYMCNTHSSHLKKAPWVYKPRHVQENITYCVQGTKSLSTSYVSRLSFRRRRFQADVGLNACYKHAAISITSLAVLPACVCEFLSSEAP